MKPGLSRDQKVALVLTFLLFLWIFGIFTPLLSTWIHLFTFPAIALNFFYGTVCHQLPAKTLFLFGKPLLVCARCTGIYLGAGLFFAAGVLLKFKRISLLLIFALVFPLYLDVARLMLHISAYSKAIAFLTGGLFGFAVSDFFLTYVFSQFRRENEK